MCECRVKILNKLLVDFISKIIQKGGQNNEMHTKEQKQVASIELNTQTNTITNIHEIYSINHAPLAFKNAVNRKSKNNAAGLKAEVYQAGEKTLKNC